MYKVHEILIPIRFCTLMLQLILSIVVIFSKSDNIYSGISSSSNTSSDYISANTS